MSKKKTAIQQQLSPQKYITTKARRLPIVHCLITPGWKESGECNIVVVRQHKSGAYTIGFYLVDTYCLGVKNTFYKFNVLDDELDCLRNDTENFEAITYNEVHNIIYGAVAYAEEWGIRPHPDFLLTQYLLEEDTEDIPLIEYEFGFKGKPFLLVKDALEFNKYKAILDESAGKDYYYSIRSIRHGLDDDEYDEYDEYDETVD
ncbi:MAG: hypothetical protein LBH80_03870 [Prevotellaceae bacterium]|jgi:hypothetical protein|nr:hypothetical protein [Prevotellaceae bacterium]